MWNFLVGAEKSRMKQPNCNMCFWKITCNNCNPEPSHNKVKVKLHEQLKLWHFLSYTYLALQPEHFVLVIFCSIYETHSTCPLFISSWSLKGNGIKPWGLYGFVWEKKKKITGGLVVIFLWPFVLRNCGVKYCPQDRREKKVVSVLGEEISALSSMQSQPQQPPIPWWYFSMFSLHSQSL